MKVLFAIGDAVTSENIVKQYYTLYGEKLEYKNVFYFKALLEEVKRDKTYDRIVIAEQLEPPQKNVVDIIDQMIFNNLDSIRDEIEDSTIIFICSDRRTKEDSLIGRLFNMGIYNLLMGDERDIVPLCGLLKEPRNRKEAKEYLGGNVSVGDTPTLSKDENEVDEIELLNISKYFNNLKTREEYLEKFAVVEEQYNEKQLQIIVTALYQNLKRGKEVYQTLSLDPRYSKYCVLPNVNVNVSKDVVENKGPINHSKSSPSAVGGILGFLAGKRNKANESQNTNNNVSDMANKASEEADLMMQQSEQEAKALAEQLRKESEERRKFEREQKMQQEAQLKAQQEAQLRAQQEAQLRAQQEAQLKAQQEAQLRAQQEAQLRAQQEAQLKAQQEAQLRAQQEAQLKAQQENLIKAQQEAQLRAQQEAQLKAQQEAQLRAQQEAQLRAQQEAQLRAQQEAQQKAEQEAKMRAEQERLQAEREKLRAEQEALRSQQNMSQQYVAPSSEYNSQNGYGVQNNYNSQSMYNSQSNYNEQNNYNSQSNASTNNTTMNTVSENNVPQFVVPADYKKVVAFIGTNKVGTSFMANVVASLTAMQGIKTSILDMTKNRGMYWFYNEAAYKKMDTVSSCMMNLSNGLATPLQVGKYKNLSLYTTIPGGKEENRKGYRHRNIVETAKRNCNLLIIDCDFTTPYDYLEMASEVYIVQDLDLIKTQETKEFLRELKSRNMDWSKLRIILNNSVKCKITPKNIVKTALTYYNDPNNTFTEEFDEIKKYVEIPMEIPNYINYLESMKDGKLNFERFTPEFQKAVAQLAVMVYGVVSNKKRGIFG